MLAFKQSLRDLACGIISGFPICCVLHYCLDTLINHRNKAIQRCYNNLVYVPCGLHMRAYKQSKLRAMVQAFIISGEIDESLTLKDANKHTIIEKDGHALLKVSDELFRKDSETVYGFIKGLPNF